METTDKVTIEVGAAINAPIEKVWDAWTKPEHIVQWNNASDDWYTPRAKNDLRVGGHFLSRMEARDGSSGFDFVGVYDEVKPHERIAYTIEDGRKVRITFTKSGSQVLVKEVFEAENENSIELQRSGWQSILNNFKKYTEELR